MKFNRLRMSYRSQNLLAGIKGKTGITPNISGRFAICLSLQDSSIPNPDEYDEGGSEIHPSVLFGEYEDVFMALMVLRLKEDNLDAGIYINRMLRAHFNRGTIMLHTRVHNLDDFYNTVNAVRSGR